jgi:virginiamycin B lyase
MRFFMRVFLAALFVCISATLPAAPPAGAKTAAAPAPKAGVKTPGILIPFENLKPEAELAVETPGWITMGEAVFIQSKSKDLVARVDPKSNKLGDPITSLNKPCAGTVSAFGSLWIPNCGAQTLTRYDLKEKKIVATVKSGVAEGSPSLAATPDSIWLLTDARTTLSRIDPADNTVVGEMRLPAGCNSVAFGEKSLWVTCPAENRVYRINPDTNLVDKRIETSASPRSVAFADGAVWVLCDKDGKIDRLDPKTNKLVRSIELSVPNGGGNMVASGGFLWVSQTGFPLTRIDPTSEKERVIQQFWGEGGGNIAATATAIWLSNSTKGTILRLDPKRVTATLAE